MARTGLRMMPTFPSSPLKFRTASFPRYGFKAGYQQAPSRERHPRVVPSRFASHLRARRCKRVFLRSVSEYAVRISTAIQAAPPLYPRGPRSGPGSAVPVHHHLGGPIRPTRRHSAISLLAAYTPCPRCAFPPRRPATGSVLSLPVLSQHVALYDSGESSGCIHPVPSPPTLAFVPLAQTRHSQYPHKSVSRGMSISELHYGSLSLQPADLFTLLTDRTAFAHSPRGFLLPGFRRFGHPLRRRLSLRWQLGNFHPRDSHPLEWQLASLHAKAGHNYNHLRTA
jgi:hypothetical protein